VREKMAGKLPVAAAIPKTPAEFKKNMYTLRKQLGIA
jgi:hypothetical protein